MNRTSFLTLSLVFSTFVGILNEGMAVSLVNNTGATVKAGSIVSVDPRSKSSFVYSSAGASDIIGVIAFDTPNLAKGDILTDGVAKVLVAERVTRGSMIRAWKLTDRISRGTGKAAKNSDTPYFLIGTALEEGVGLIKCQLSLRFIPIASTHNLTLTGTVTLPSTTSIGSVSSTEIGYLNGVTSSLQDQLNAKLSSIPIATTTTLGGVIVGANLTVDVNGVLNADGGAGAANWGSIGDDIAKQLDLQTALGLKAPLANPTFTGTFTLGSSAPKISMGQDASGLYVEQQGVSNSTENMRFQSSKSGDTTNYSVFTIDPNIGFLFSGLGTGVTNMGVGFTSPLSKVAINGGLHVGGETDAGDNNILVDGFIKTVGGIHVGGTSDPGADNLIVDGTSSFGGDLNSTSFVSGFAGSGWKMDEATGKYNLTVDNLTVRESLTAYELDINKINSVNGGIVVSVANGTAMNVSGTTIYFDEDGGNKQIQFAVNDYIRAQIWTGRGIAAYVGHVTAVNHSNTYGLANIVADTVSGTPWNGMELVQIGSSSDAARQNLIYITASDTNNPYIDMLAGVNAGSFTGKQKLRIGNLTGITDASFGGALSGYGLYADNVFLKGKMIIASGSSGYDNITDKPTIPTNTNQLTDGANLGGTATWAGVSGVGKPADNATVGADWSVNLSNIPSTLGAPAGSGLFLSSTNMGYYTGGAWKTYMDSSGNLVLGDIAGGNTGLSWSQGAGTLTIKGAITATSGIIGGFTIDPTEGLYAGSDATRVQMKPGVGYWAGATAVGDAPFSVSQTGALIARGVAEIGTNAAVVDGKDMNIAIMNNDIWENSYNGDESHIQFNYKSYVGTPDHYRGVIFYNGRGNDATYGRKMLTISGLDNVVFVGSSTVGKNDVTFKALNDAEFSGSTEFKGAMTSTGTTIDLNGGHNRAVSLNNDTCAIDESDISGFNLTVTPKGSKILVMFSAPFHPISGNSSFWIAINVDGSNVYTAYQLISSTSYIISCQTIQNVTPNVAIVVKMRWSGSTTIQYLGLSGTYGYGELSVVDLF